MKSAATGDGFGPDEEGHKSLFDQVARNLPFVTKTNAARKAKKPFSLSQPTAIFLLIAVAATGGLRILFIFTSFTRFTLSSFG